MSSLYISLLALQVFCKPTSVSSVHIVEFVWDLSGSNGDNEPKKAELAKAVVLECYKAREKTETKRNFVVPLLLNCTVPSTASDVKLLYLIILEKVSGPLWTSCSDWLPTS